MKKIIFTIWLCSTLLIANYSLLIAQTGWFQQNSGTSQSFDCVYFVNVQTGFAGGGFRIFKTTNGGTSWLQKDLPDTISIQSIRFLNSSTGFACGGRYVNQYLSNQHLFKTTNAGENWNMIFQTSASMTSEYFLDVMPVDSLIYLTRGGTDAMATVGSLLISMNNGANFAISNIGNVAKVEKLSFLNSQTGWVSTTWGTDVPLSKRKIYKTTNHGLNWTMQYRDSSMQSGFSLLDFEIQFVNQNTGYGLYHKMNIVKFIKSTNSGATWDSTSLPYTKYNGMFFADANTGWIGGRWYPDTVIIIRTTTGGSNWHVQKKGNFILNAIYFVNNLTGWAVGDGGIILKTVTGGVTGVQNISSEIPSTYSLSQNYPNPFNPATKIKFDIQKSVVSSQYSVVTLKVYDVMGREVQTLVNEQLAPGTYIVDFNATNFPSGIYFYRLITDGFSETKRMTLIK